MDFWPVFLIFCFMRVWMLHENGQLFAFGSSHSRKGPAEKPGSVRIVRSPLLGSINSNFKRISSHVERSFSVQVARSSSGDAMDVTFQSFNTPNGPTVAYAIILTTDVDGIKPIKGSLVKTYNDFKNGLTRTYVTSVVEQQITGNTDLLNKISVHVGDGTVSRGYVNGPLDPNLQYRLSVAAFSAITYDPATDTINEDQSTATITAFSGFASKTITKTEKSGSVQVVRSSLLDSKNFAFKGFSGHAERSFSVQVARSHSGDAMDITFQSFNTSNGPTVAYAIILTTDFTGDKPTKGSLAKTYNDFKNGLTKTYVTSVVEQSSVGNTGQLNKISVRMGDSTVSRGYVNGPLDPTLQYRLSVAAFSSINYNPATDTINEDMSMATITAFSGFGSKTTTNTEKLGSVQVVRSSLLDSKNITFKGFSGHAEKSFSVQVARSSSGDAMDVTFQSFNNSNGPTVAYAIILTTDLIGDKPTKGSLAKTYTDFKNGLTRTYVTTIVEQQITGNTDLLNKISVRVGDGTVSRGYVNGPLDPALQYRLSVAVFSAINYNPATDTINEDQSTATITGFSGFATKTTTFTEKSGSVQVVRSSLLDSKNIAFKGFSGHVDRSFSVQVARSSSGDAMDVTFQSFNTSNGPTVAYAIILTTDFTGDKPIKGSLANTYNDFKNGLTRTYVSSVVEQQNIENTDQLNKISVRVGDSAVSRGYTNGPLDPTLTYRLSVAAFSAINYDPATDTINEDLSTATVTGFSGFAPRTITHTEKSGSVQVVRSSLLDSKNIAFKGISGHAERAFSVQVARSSSGDAMDITFQSFNTTNGPTVAYAIILTTDFTGIKPIKGSLANTYNDFTNGLTRTYVTSIIEQQNTGNTDQLNKISVRVGDGTISRGYVNGPLDPNLQYRFSLAAFSSVNYDPATDTVNEDLSTATVTSFSGFAPRTITHTEKSGSVQVIRSSLLESKNIAFKTISGHAEKAVSVQVARSSSGDAMDVTFQSFNTSNGPTVAYAIILTTDFNGTKPTTGSLSKTYNDYRNGLTRTYVTSVVEQQNTRNADQLNKISVHVGDGTVSRGYVNGPLDPNLQYRLSIAAFSAINYDPATDTIKEDQSTATISSFSGFASKTTTITEKSGSVQVVRSSLLDSKIIAFKSISGHAEKAVSVQVARSSSGDAMDVTFQSFNTSNGPTVAYAIILTTDFNGTKPTTASLTKTYDDFRNGLTRTYVASVVEQQNTGNTDQLNKISVHVGDGTVSRGYVNGPLDPNLQYRLSIAAFSAINYDPATDTIKEDQSSATISSFSGFASKTKTHTEKSGSVQVVRSSLLDSKIIAFKTISGHADKFFSVQVARSSSGDAMDVTFQSFNTSNGPTVAYAIILTTDFNGTKPTKGSLTKTYDDFRNGLTRTYVASVVEQQITGNTDQSNKISVHVGDGTVSRGYVNGPLDPNLQYRLSIAAFSAINYDPATDTIKEDQSSATISSFSGFASKTTTHTEKSGSVQVVRSSLLDSKIIAFKTISGHAEKPVSVQVARSFSGDAMDVTFQSFNTSNGPTVAYAIILTTDFNGTKPTTGSLTKTYDDFRNGLTRTYVASVVEQNTGNTDQLNKISVHVGDGTVSRGYVNGPLDPNLQYRLSIAAFSAINYDPATDTIKEDQSSATISSFSGFASKATTITEKSGSVQIVRSSLLDSKNITFKTISGHAEKAVSVQVARSSSGDAMDVTFQSFNTSNGPTVAYAIILTTDFNGTKPTTGSLTKTYDDFRNGLTRTYVASVVEQQNTGNDDQLNKISVHVGDGTVSRGYVNGPLDPSLQYRLSIAAFSAINYDPATDTIKEDQSSATITGFSGFASKTTTITEKSGSVQVVRSSLLESKNIAFKSISGHAEKAVSVQVARSSSGDAMDVTFQSFNISSGPTVAYAIILTTDFNGTKPTTGSLTKTYDDFRNGMTRTYVTSVVEQQNTENADQLNKISVHVGDGTASRGYVNGPLDPNLQYRLSIAAFSAINYDPATDSINKDQSTATISSFSGFASKTTTITEKSGSVQIVRSSLLDSKNITFKSISGHAEKAVSVQVARSSSGDAMDVAFQSFNTSNGPTVAYAIILTTDFNGTKPTTGSLTKTYDDFRNGLTRTYVASVVEQQNTGNADQLNKINVHVGDGTVSRGYVNGPLDSNLQYRLSIAAFSAINYDPATDTIKEDQSSATISSFSGFASKTTTHTEKSGSVQVVRSSLLDSKNITFKSISGHAEKPVSVQVARSSSGDAMDVTFQNFNTSNGPTVAYAIILTTDFNGTKPTTGSLTKTYDDFRNGLTRTYVASVVEQNTGNADQLNKISVPVGDGTVSRGYVNGPLDPNLQYRLSVAAFSSINYDPATDTINEAQSTATISSFSSFTSKTSTDTEPAAVKNLWSAAFSADSVFLAWSRPDGYKRAYSYRVQTDVSSSSKLIDNIVVKSESTRIVNLTPGETYTFLVYTRAADNVTESDPVSLTTCTVPGQASAIAVNSFQLSNALEVTWTAPAGKVDYYKVSVTGDIDDAQQTNSTQATFTGLLPGREYTVTVQTVSGKCSKTSPPVTEATYPTPPGSPIINTIGTDSVALSWSSPVNMTDVMKLYYINYWNSYSSDTVTSHTPNITLHSLSPGTNYSINVATVGVQGYRSTPVTRSVYTSPEEKSGSVQVVRSSSGNVMDVSFKSFDTSNGPIVAYAIVMTTDTDGNKPTKGSLSKTYIDFRNGLTRTYVTSIVEQRNTENTDQLNKISVRVGNGTLSKAYINGPLDPNLQYRLSIAGFTALNYDAATNTINEDQSTAIVTDFYDSTSTATDIEPAPVKNLWSAAFSADSVFLAWSRPDGYRRAYSYRVQTDVTSSSKPINSIVVKAESATIVDLTPGETYTFLVYTRAADNITESDPVSLTICTVPGQASVVSVNNFQLSNALGVTWTAPAGKVDYYKVSLTGALTDTQQTNSTQVTFMGLLPGREYTVTVQTVSGKCSKTSPPVTEATYPTPPGPLIINTIGADSVALSWSSPAIMNDVMKLYYITYMNSYSTITVTSHAPKMTLRSLSPGTNYSISVVTVGVRGYQSIPVTRSVYTSPEEKPASVQVVRSSTGDAMDVTFQRFDTSNGPIVAYAIILTTDVNGDKPTKGSLAKTYDDFENGLTGTYVTSVVEQWNTRKVAQSKEIRVRVGDGAVSRGYVNGPLDPNLQYRVSIAGLTAVNYDAAMNTINEDQSTATITGFYDSATKTTTTATTTDLGPEKPFIGQVVRSSSGDAIDVTFQRFYTSNEPIVAYAIIMTTDVIGDKPTKGCLAKTYDDFRNGVTSTYVTSVVEQRNTRKAAQSKEISVQVGDGTVSKGYVNGPLNPNLEYRLSIAGLTAVNYDAATNTINEDRSKAIITGFSDFASTTTDIEPVEEANSVQFVRSSLVESMGGTFKGISGTAEEPGNVQVVRSSKGDAMDVTFQRFDTSNGPAVAYAIIMTTDFNGDKPAEGSLAKTYNNFRNGLTKTYVTSVLEQQKTAKAAPSKEISVRVGDGTVSRGYANGPLDPNLQYRVSVAGFADINYDPATNTINEDRSMATVTSFSNSASTAPLFSTPKRGAVFGAVIGSILGISALGALGYLFCKKRRKNTGYVKTALIRRQPMKTENFQATYEKLKANDNKALIMEFDSLQSSGASQSQSVAIHTANTEKAQLDAVAMYEMSRIKVTSLEGSAYGYMNASYIAGNKSRKEFIAAQNPLPNTAGYFWYIIWEQNVNTIVMLSDCQETSMLLKGHQHYSLSHQNTESASGGYNEPNTHVQNQSAKATVIHTANSSEKLKGSQHFSFSQKTDSATGDYNQADHSNQNLSAQAAMKQTVISSEQQQGRQHFSFSHQSTESASGDYNHQGRSIQNMSARPTVNQTVVSSEQQQGGQHFSFSQSTKSAAGGYNLSDRSVQDMSAKTTVTQAAASSQQPKVCSEIYWPSGEAKVFGDLKVTFISEEILRYWTIRTFMVTNVKSNESRRVRQFHYTSWTYSWDFNDRDVLIEFVNLVQQHRMENSPNYPTLVHCSTGADKSGVFIALDCIINQLEENSAVDVYGIVHRMNRQRPSMIQTADQYIFLYQCSLEIIMGRKEETVVYKYETYQKVREITV